MVLLSPFMPGEQVKVKLQPSSLYIVTQPLEGDPDHYQWALVSTRMAHQATWHSWRVRKPFSSAKAVPGHMVVAPIGYSTPNLQPAEMYQVEELGDVHSYTHGRPNLCFFRITGWRPEKIPHAGLGIDNLEQICEEAFISSYVTISMNRANKIHSGNWTLKVLTRLAKYHLLTIHGVNNSKAIEDGVNNVTRVCVQKYSRRVAKEQEWNPPVLDLPA